MQQAFEIIPVTTLRVVKILPTQELCLLKVWVVQVTKPAILQSISSVRRQVD